MHRSYFRCIRGCPGEYSLYDVIYTCPHCGGLLEVAHDEDALSDRSAAAWMHLFEQRSGTTQWPYGSGVWRYKEWVAPDLDDDNIVSTFEGNTNLFHARRLGIELGVPELWIKQSGNSHTGSFKDLGMTVLVSVVKQMIAQGKPIRAVAAASTGDTSAALAAYGATAGIPTVVFLPSGKVSQAQLIQPIANGATVLALDTDFDGCMRIVKEVTRNKTIYLANSMNSLRIEGQKTVGIEVVQQFDWEVPDWFVIPVGNLGNISALGKGLLMMKKLGLINKLPRLAAAQAANANPFYLSWKKDFGAKIAVKANPTLASAIQIGDPVSYEKAVTVLQEFEGVVEQATEAELAEASARADLNGLYTCPHTGVALASLKKLVDKGVIQSGERVVVISTAHGLKFTQFKMRYHMRELEGIDARLANEPIYLPADVDAVKRALDERLGAPVSA